MLDYIHRCEDDYILSIEGHFFVKRKGKEYYCDRYLEWALDVFRDGIVNNMFIMEREIPDYSAIEVDTLVEFARIHDEPLGESLGIHEKIPFSK